MYGPKSFRFCNDEDGGPKLNVDIVQHYDPKNRNDIPQKIKSYQDICLCVSIPYDVQQMARWSINNHGNELLAYYETNW